MTLPSMQQGETIQKNPIIFDDHLDHSQIELQYFVDTRIGKNTCMARCEFCWLDKPHLSDFKQDPAEATRIIEGLRSKGFKVIPLVSDSFAEGGKYLRSGLFYNNEDWYMGSAAWSSGRPLLEDNAEELLQLCVDNKIHTIIMTSHGTQSKERPFKGLTQPAMVAKAVRRVQEFREKHNYDMRIILTFTIGKLNKSAAHIRACFDYCENLGVDVIRFNQFGDFKQDHPEHALTKEEVAEVYRTLKDVYDSYPGKVTMSVSEDFGFWGVEVMGFPEGVGHCVAGEYLFGVVYPYVYVCPVDLTLVAGKINENFEIEWNKPVIERLMKTKKHEDFSGCIAVSYAHSEQVRELVNPNGASEKFMPSEPCGSTEQVIPAGQLVQLQGKRRVDATPAL